ncbi:molybdenum cofactor cytidylyltransferase [Massilia eurypsychrophila]|jgi:molybdenum cofactor cytidylyltransferase|uniref:Molybdenum cofactor cytidylyltransferase n=1 Tax=Massilia eurypsychrophila TaxID=1485217 RepID=A0A2G8TG92_9BURK|nr:nucleotidyltransferase family protein [Massilia eurypsychrophila]PIL44658.1 molybdenum cofactor cytidylyltransferase [Massilia eurypsychrophila]
MGCLLKQGGGLYPRLRVGAVLLAAGQGSRMGGVAKSLIRLQGVPLINRQLIALSGAGVDQVVVVTGHARDAVEAEVQSFPVTLAYNPDYRMGQQGSVRVGLAALDGNFDAVFVMLADQPLIGAADLTELIAAFKQRPGGNVLVPVVDGRRGNPILLDAAARAEILASDTNLGCHHLIERRPELVHVHATRNTRFVSDLDTLDDVQQLATRTGWKLELPA